MGQGRSRAGCCTLREKEQQLKEDEQGQSSPPGRHPFFSHSEMLLDLESALFVAFSPMWHPSEGTSARRRLAVASTSKVHVYRMYGEFVDDDMSVPVIPEEQKPFTLALEYTMEMEKDLTITGMMFGERGDEGFARGAATSLVVAAGPQNGTSESSSHMARIWACDAATEAEFEAKQQSTSWRWNEGFVGSLDLHTAKIFRLGLSSRFLITADIAGWCRTWDKLKAFSCRAGKRLHGEGEEPGALADITSDRHFLYSVGAVDLSVRIWSIPDLRPVMTLSAELPSSGQFLAPPCSPSSESKSRASVEVTAKVEWKCSCLPGDSAVIRLDQTPQLSRLTGVQRPTSRWTGAQPSEKVRQGAKPRGSLYITGDLAMGGGSVVMAWSLGASPECHTLEVVPEAEISTIAYGPYDNGPLITTGRSGIVRVWDFVPKLMCVQMAQVLVRGCSPAIAVDPVSSALYSVVGNERLFIWRRMHKVLADVESCY